MGEMLEVIALHNHDSLFVQSSSPLSSVHVITVAGTGSREASNNSNCEETNNLPIDDWLPITESRNGSICSSVFHLLSSGIGFQVLLLPVAFSILGWSWGSICLSLAFAWQLYTIWLLVHLHEPISAGIRYSRFLQLSIAAFGQKLGKLLSIFPVMYLSGGTCCIMIITGSKTMELLLETISGNIDGLKSITGTGWFFIFYCIAILMAQRPNLNSIFGLSIIAAITAVGYCTLIWVFMISKGRIYDDFRSELEMGEFGSATFSDVLIALGIIMLSFRGHNLILEIQGTLPSSSKFPSSKPMWRGVLISYILIAICVFPLAIAGFWTYGHKMPKKIGNISILLEFYSQNASKFIRTLLYILVLINSLSSFQIYAMPVFDNLEMRYISIKNKPCSRWVRTGLRLFFGGIVLFIAIAFPFLPSLAAVVGGMALPLTFVYPCFMWILLEKPCKSSPILWLNLGLGCLGLILSVLIVVAAVWSLTTNGLNANFFKP